jgi:hypothetical protein
VPETAGLALCHRYAALFAFVFWRLQTGHRYAALLRTLR